MHTKAKDQKEANWLIKNAEDAGIDLDEDVGYEIAEKLGDKAPAAFKRSYDKF
jgi:hypothetical protein